MGTCAFCGKQGPMTREHVFGDWLKKVLRRGPNRTSQRLGSVQADRGRGFVTYQNDLSHGRALGSTQVPIACHQCNSGWMGVVQNRARAPLTRLINDSGALVTEDELDAVVNWAVMTSMTAEYTNPELEARAIPQAERMELRAACLGQRAPVLTGWLVMLGRYAGSEATSGPDNVPLAYRHYSHPISNGSAIQSSTFRLGELYLATWSGLDTYSAMRLSIVAQAGRYGVFALPQCLRRAGPPNLFIHDKVADDISWVVRRNLREAYQRSLWGNPSPEAQAGVGPEISEALCRHHRADVALSAQK